VLKINVNCP